MKTTSLPIIAVVVMSAWATTTTLHAAEPSSTGNASRPMSDSTPRQTTSASSDNSRSSAGSANSSADMDSTQGRTGGALPMSDNTPEQDASAPNGSTQTAVAGNVNADANTTAQIQKAFLANGSGLSSSARNVTVVTVNGRVTLRGSVRTAEDKRLVGEMAAKIPELRNVDNQLDVK